ncbi:MAG: DUF885 domain-containing protein [Fidelibacterota bacterium]|nr:MAG: DUF885 domain-containing protein [Candidatus Neomarinimicrobiota bacterium]
MKQRTLIMWTGFVMLAMSTGCQQGSRDWGRFVDNFIEGYFEANPTAAVYAGRHEYDGQLPDFSAEGLAQSSDWLKAQRERALGFETESLSEAQRFERDYMLAAIDGQLFWLEDAGWPYKNPAFYANPLDPSVYVTREYAPLEQRMRGFITFARGIPAVTDHARNNLRPPLPRTYVQLGHILFGGLAMFFEDDLPRVFAPVKDDQIQAEFQQANAGAVQALKGLDEWFTSLEATATDEFALGPELFKKMLWATQGLEITLEDLEASGQRDLERNLSALREACAELAPDKTIPECVAMVMGDKPKDGPIEEAREQLNTLKQFVVDQDLVAIPGEEEALVDTSPPFMRWNLAYIDIPGPYEKGLPSTYYIAPPDPSWSEEEQRAYIPGIDDLLFTSVHEVWPGHFLNYLHSNRTDSEIGRVFGNYAFSEGWAHYTEEMMWEAGLNEGDPATHIGQLLNALLRNVRYLSAIGLHTQGMTVAESERMFQELSYQDPGNARQQAARGTFDPGYLNYTLGKLMILKLREDWTAGREGREAWKVFHDQLLSHGKPPLPLVRKAMLGEDAGAAL